MHRRILLISHFYPPHQMGGTEVLTHSIARELAERGHAVRVVCAAGWGTGDAGLTAERETLDGVEVERLRFNWQRAPDVFRSLYDNALVHAHLQEVIGQFQPDVMHMTSGYTLSASPIVAAQAAALPVLLTATDFWFLCARNTLLERGASLCSGPETGWKCLKCHAASAKVYRWPSAVLPEPVVRRLLTAVATSPAATGLRGLRGLVGDWDQRRQFLAGILDRVDRIVTASTLVREMLVTYGVAPDRLTLSAYGIDTSWAQGHTAKTSASHLRIGFIGQMLPAKGVDLLLRAVAGLDRSLPVKLILYGDPAKEPAYGAKLKALAGDDPRIEFAGTFPNHQMGEVLSGIDALAVPSVWYDFPLVIPSALATRTPVLATDLPGMNELIRHEVNGLLFPLHDADGLAGAIRRLCVEPDLLARLRDGIEPVKTVEEMVDEYEGHYDALHR